jgi:hypothetical protein
VRPQRTRLAISRWRPGPGRRRAALGAGEDLDAGGIQAADVVATRVACRRQHPEELDELRLRVHRGRVEARQHLGRHGVALERRRLALALEDVGVVVEYGDRRDHWDVERPKAWNELVRNALLVDAVHPPRDTRVGGGERIVDAADVGDGPDAVGARLVDDGAQDLAAEHGSTGG